jgi:deoxycytidine triphosphate deaminase
VKPKPRAGLLYSGASLERLLKSGVIFDAGSWRTDHVRATGYDLTLAEDLLVIPERSGEPSVAVFPRGSARATDILLAPGDTALAASQERIHMPWDCGGIIGPKFSLAARGLLVLTGIAIDPGYGLQRDSHGWIPVPDQRLHFVLANVGSDTIALRPKEERLACIQFFLVEPLEPSQRRPIASLGFLAHDEFFESKPPLEAGLVFFKNVRDISERVDAALAAATRTKEEVEVLASRVEKVEGGSNFVVVFGVYLVTVTVVGIAVSLILQAVERFPRHPSLALIIASAAGGGVFLIGVVVAFGLGLRQLLSGLRRLPSPNENP